MVDDTAIARALIQDSEVLGLSAAEIRAVTGWTEKKLKDAVKGCVDGGIIVFANGIYIAPSSFKWLELRVLEVVSRRLAKDHLSQDVSLEAIRTEVFRSIRPEIERAVIESLRATGKIFIKGETVELAGHNSQLSDAESDALAIMVEKFIGAGLEVPKPDDVVNETAAKLGLQKKVVDTLFQQLVRSGKLIRISPDIFLSARALTDLIDRVREFAGRSPDRTIDVPAFKELAGVSRKYAIPLLEYFDQTRITARRGDKRIVI
jgi:selenocysteine-specific elongation factor